MMQYRKATFADIEAIYHLVNDYATDGVMLARSRNTLYETLRDMIVAVDEEGGWLASAACTSSGTAWRRSARWRSRQS